MTSYDLMLGVFHRIVLPFIALVIFAIGVAEAVVRTGRRRMKNAAPERQFRKRQTVKKHL